MNHLIKSLVLTAALVSANSVFATEINSSKQISFTMPAFANGAAMPAQYTFCIPANKNHIQSGPNINPEVRWSKLPQGTQSLVLLAVDTDGPMDPQKINKEGIIIPKKIPRGDFYHWVMADIPPAIHEIKVGQDSVGITDGGKKPGLTSYGVRGINDYTKWFANDPKMKGQYGGYDGPCPPWNDELLHHYRFRLYALDVKTLGLKGNFDARMVLKAMQGHILAEKEWVGTYNLNPMKKGENLF